MNLDTINAQFDIAVIGGFATKLWHWCASARRENRRGALRNNGGKGRQDRHTQPVIELHGSVNWRDPDGNQLLVMGGGKQQTIQRHPVLRRYLELFTEHLSTGRTKLMAIGYGFNDLHIRHLRYSRNTVLDANASRESVGP